MAIPGSANMGNPSCEHPFIPPSTGTPCGTAARPPMSLQVSWRKWGLHKLPSVVDSKHPAGKALTPSLVRSHILQKPGSATAKNLCGETAQPRAHRLQAVPAADGICARPEICPWLCPRLWDNPLHGVCQQHNPGTTGCQDQAAAHSSSGRADVTTQPQAKQNFLCIQTRLRPEHSSPGLSV